MQDSSLARISRTRRSLKAKLIGLVASVALGLAGALLWSGTASAQLPKIVMAPHDGWNMGNSISSSPGLCQYSWWNPYYQLGGTQNYPNGTWYANEYRGTKSFTDHTYREYYAVQRNGATMSQIAGGNEILWAVIGYKWPEKFEMPGSFPADLVYKTLEACNGLIQQRAYAWTPYAGDDYYVFKESIVANTKAYGWHEVRGAIHHKYVEQKAWEGWLGMPTTDEEAAIGGRVSRFRNGAIFWSGASGSRTMGNDVFDKWQSLNGTAGPLGYPTSDNSFYQQQGTTTGTTTPITYHKTYFQNGCHIEASAGGANAYCNGKAVTSAPFVSSPTPGNLIPYANFTWSRRTGTGNGVYFNGGSSYDSDGSISSYQWKWGSTVIGHGRELVYSFGNATTSASVTLTVTDNRGSVKAVTKTLSLPNRAPSVYDNSPSGGTTVGTVTPTLRGIASDPDGEALQYNYHLTGPFVDIWSGWVSGAWTVPAQRLDPGDSYAWTVQVRDPRGATASRSSDFRVAMLQTAKEMVSISTGNGYWQVASDGGVFSYGSARFHGSLPGLGVRVTNIIGMARTPTDNGYWLVGSDGGVFAFGDAGFHGSLPNLNIRVNNIVAMAPTSDGKGYWLVGSDGGVFAFGNAGFHGSMGGKPLNAPVEGIAPTRTSQGYWLVARDGGVFAFGDAPFFGSMGGQPLNYPVMDIDPTPDSGGYWMVAQDGGVFAFGNAPFYGSMAGKPLNGYINTLTPTSNGKGYWLAGCDGGVFAFGNAPFYGSNPTYQCRGIR